MRINKYKYIKNFRCIFCKKNHFSKIKKLKFKPIRDFKNKKMINTNEYLLFYHNCSKLRTKIFYILTKSVLYKNIIKTSQIFGYFKYHSVAYFLNEENHTNLLIYAKDSLTVLQKKYINKKDLDYYFSDDGINGVMFL